MKVYCFMCIEDVFRFFVRSA